MELFDERLGDFEGHTIEFGTGFEAVGELQSACRTYFELVGEVFRHRPWIELQVERIEREERRGLGIFEGLVPLFQGDSIDDMFGDAISVEVQQREGIHDAISASGFIADALDLIEDRLVMAPEFGARFELHFC